MKPADPDWKKPELLSFMEPLSYGGKDDVRWRINVGDYVRVETKRVDRPFFAVVRNRRSAYGPPMFPEGAYWFPLLYVEALDQSFNGEVSEDCCGLVTTEELARLILEDKP